MMRHPVRSGTRNSKSGQDIRYGLLSLRTNASLIRFRQCYPLSIDLEKGYSQKTNCQEG